MADPKPVEELTSVEKDSGGNTYTRTYDEVKKEFDQLNPGTINDACTAWYNAAGHLGDLAGQLRQHGHDLLDSWESDAATGAQKQLQTAEATSRALADQAMHMTRATDYAAKYAQWYKDNFPKDVGFSGVGQEGTDNAVKHLTNLLSRYNEVTAYSVPPQVRADYVNPKTGGGDPPGKDKFGKTPGSPTAPGVPHPGGPGGTHPGGGLPGSGGTHPPGTGGIGGHPPGAGGSGTGIGGTHVPGAGSGGAGSGLGSGGAGAWGADNPYDPGSALAGSGTGGGLGGGLGGGAGGLGSGGGVGSGLGADGGGLGAGAGGVGAGGVGGGLGAGGVGAGRGGPGAGGAGAGKGGLGAGEGAGTGSGAAGRGGAPMGGHGGEDEEERERSTWLTEDEGVWGGENDAPPPVIGG